MIYTTIVLVTWAFLGVFAIPTIIPHNNYIFLWVMYGLLMLQFTIRWLESIAESSKK